MRRALLGLCAALAACSPAPDRPVPGASLTASSASARAPRAAAPRTSDVACGDDVTLDGSGAPALRYLYTYDDRGRLARADGAYATGGADDAIAYSYDYLDHMTHMTETHGWGDAQVETIADYDTLGDLIAYSTDTLRGSAHDHLAYAFADFTDLGQPTTEVIRDTGQPDAHYHLAYDPAGRIQLVVADGGYTTAYTYDDDARTTTIDTDQGAFHGVIAFDDQNRELSETWGGTDPAAIASEQVYTYDGDRLLALTYRSGTQAAPREETVTEVDTLRYDCATAR